MWLDMVTEYPAQDVIIKSKNELYFSATVDLNKEALVTPLKTVLK